MSPCNLARDDIDRPGPPPSPHEERPFVKQYGARRTGTNLARWILAERFPRVHVLMHLLGSKHGLPSSLVLGQGVDWSRPAVELVREATAQVPADTTDLSHPAQRAQLERLAEPLVAALRAGSLRYVISIKEPHAWLWSILRSRGWLPPQRANGSRRPLPAEQFSGLCSACAEFNACYRAWFELLDRAPTQCVIIRHEELLAAPEPAVARLASCLGASPDDAIEPQLPTGIVLPAHWDDVPSPVHFEPFDATFYRNRHFLELLGQDVLTLAAEAMDWQLLARCGYRPLPHRVRISISA